MKKRGYGCNCIDDMFYARDCLIWKLEIDKKELQERIDNAIKYLENLKERVFVTEFDVDKIIDILKGSDKSE